MSVATMCSMARRFRGLMLGVTVAAVLVGCEAGEGNDREREERSTPIAATEVVPRDLSRQLSMSGTVEPRVSIRLAARTSGTLRTVGPEEGERVEEGEVLAALDMSEEEAELRRAQAREQETRLSYERIAGLRRQQAVSQAEYERARAEYEVAESERGLWQTRVDFGRILAPRDAVVTARYFEPGEAVQAGETMFELGAMDELVIRLGVSELDVVYLEQGQAVPVTLDALPDNTLEARIRRVFPGAEATSRLVTVEVALPPDAADRGVRPGFLGRVRMPIDPRPDALAVPAAAIGEDGDTHYVYVVEDEKLVHREVSVGVTRGQWTEITEGIAVDEIVLATNPLDMSDGQRVRIVGWRG